MKWNFNEEMRLNHGWLLFAGLLFVVLGLLLLLIFYCPESAINLMVTLCFSLAGIGTIIHAFRFWYRKKIGLVLTLVLGCMYLSYGITFLLNEWFFIYPLLSALLLYLALAFIILGIFRIYVAIKARFEHGFTWMFYNGLINLLLAGCAFYGYKTVPFSLLTVSVGSDILATGISLLALYIANESKA